MNLEQLIRDKRICLWKFLIYKEGYIDIEEKKLKMIEYDKYSISRCIRCNIYSIIKNEKNCFYYISLKNFENNYRNKIDLLGYKFKKSKEL